MHKFDYSFLKNMIPADIAGLTGVIADLNSKETVRKLQYVETFEKLRQKAIVESVKGSNAIEGIVTTEDRIKDIMEGASPVTHDEMEISGYRDALKMIHEHHHEMDVEQDTIRFLHRMLLEQTRPAEAGKYKTNNNFILEYGPEGVRRVKFMPVRAKEVDECMDQLLLAYYAARQDSEISLLLLIPCFILDYLCIHPFSDGNGRTSRLLMVLLVYMAGYDIVRYISLEKIINEYKYGYYEALEASTASWHENSNDYVPFIMFFLRIIYKSFKMLDESFTDISLKKAKKSERVEAVALNAIVPISKAEILDKLPDVSIATVERVLGRLVKEDKLSIIGTFKNARYVRK